MYRGAHHQQATQHWEKSQADGSIDPEPIKWVSPMSRATFGDKIVVGREDIDQQAMSDIGPMLYQQDYDEADRLLQEAQQDLADPEAAYQSLLDPPDGEPARPTLTPGMRREIVNGSSSFFHIYLFDSCDEDGDIVDIIIGGHRFATVPITKAGTTLSVPLSNDAPTPISIRGIWDGGGGITVACQTSQGQGFVRVMAPGEEQVLAVVGR